MKRRVLLTVTLILISSLFISYLPACMCQYQDDRDYLYSIIRSEIKTDSDGTDYFSDLDNKDLEKMMREMLKIEKETGQKDKVWTKEEIDALKVQLFGDKDAEKTEETAIADETDEQTSEATSTEAQQAEFLTPIKYELTSLDIKSVYEPREGDHQMDEYDDTLFGGQWDLDTSDPSKCEIVIAPAIIEDPSNPGEFIMTPYYAEVYLSGPARDYDMDTASVLARSAEASRWTNTEGLNKYEYLEMDDYLIEGRCISEVAGGGQGDEEKHLVITWRETTATFENKKIFGEVICFWGRVSPDSFTVVEDSKTTVIAFTGEIVE